MSDLDATFAGPSLIGNLKSALYSMAILSQDRPQWDEQQLVAPCKMLIASGLMLGLQAVAEMILIEKVFHLNGLNLDLRYYEKEEKFRVEGDDYIKYQISSPILNKVLVKYGLHRSPDNYEGPILFTGKAYHTKIDVARRTPFMSAPIRFERDIHKFWESVNCTAYIVYEDNSGKDFDHIDAREVFWKMMGLR